MYTGYVYAMSDLEMFEYPLNMPTGCPSYVARSVQEQCTGAVRRALEGHSAEQLRNEFVRAISDEARTMRAAIDGMLANGIGEDHRGWWIRWGYRTVTEARSNAWRLAEFRDALARDDLSHVTSGHSVSPHTYHVYRRDQGSPSGCLLVASAGHDLPGVDIVLARSGRHTVQGAQRGEMANRRALRGF